MESGETGCQQCSEGGECLAWEEGGWRQNRGQSRIQPELSVRWERAKQCSGMILIIQVFRIFESLLPSPHYLFSFLLPPIQNTLTAFYYTALEGQMDGARTKTFIGFLIESLTCLA